MPEATLLSRDIGERDPRGWLRGRGNRSRPQACPPKAACYPDCSAAANQPPQAGSQGAGPEDISPESVNSKTVNSESASLEGARLRGARLRGARLRGARLRGARLRGARLRGASLEGASRPRPGRHARAQPGRRRGAAGGQNRATRRGIPHRESRHGSHDRPRPGGGTTHERIARDGTAQYSGARRGGANDTRANVGRPRSAGFPDGDASHGDAYGSSSRHSGLADSGYRNGSVRDGGAYSARYSNARSRNARNSTAADSSARYSNARSGSACGGTAVGGGAGKKSVHGGTANDNRARRVRRNSSGEDRTGYAPGGGEGNAHKGHRAGRRPATSATCRGGGAARRAGERPRDRAEHPGTGQRVPSARTHHGPPPDHTSPTAGVHHT
jgi:uncharacterized protein YjbI with pentapeptide repeats